MPAPTSFPKTKIKVLLLEGIHPSAIELFAKETFQVESVKGALKPEELRERIGDIHLLGIRSKTHVDDESLAAADKLLAVGCLRTGKNRVDME